MLQRSASKAGTKLASQTAVAIATTRVKLMKHVYHASDGADITKTQPVWNN
jgi:hypothetical protein